MQGTRELYEERIIRIQLYIQRNLEERLPLDELADIAGFSPYHFHRIFRAMVGEPLKEFIRRIRLERAARELKYTDRQVIDIALEAGYETHESFTRAFRAKFGVPPRQFRNDHRHESIHSDTRRDRTLVATITRPGGEEMDVKIEGFEPMTVAFVRHVGPYCECGTAWHKLCSNQAVLAAMTSQPKMIGISYDDPDVTDADKCRYDACATVNDDFEPSGGVDKQVIEGGEFAVVVHKGSYDGLHACYRWLYGEWLPGSGREAAKTLPALEIYHSDPNKTPPEELLTEIRIPLK